MSKQEKLLIIVESPSKTKTIAKYVDNASVIASIGHFKDLPKKEMGNQRSHTYPGGSANSTSTIC